MEFDWTYTLGLLLNKNFWMATWTVIELSILVWLIGILLGLSWPLQSNPALSLLHG